METELLEEEMFARGNLVPLPLALWRSVDVGRKNIAIDYFGREFTYEEMARMVGTFSRIISSLLGSDSSGTKPSRPSRVAIFAPNTPEFIFAYYGTILAGHVASPVNYVPLAKQLLYLKPKEVAVGDELKKQFEYSKPDLIFVAEPFWPMLERVGEEYTRKAKIVVFSPGSFLSGAKKLFYPAFSFLKYGSIKIPNSANVFSLKKLLSLPWPNPFGVFEDYFRAEHNPDELIHLQYTGGTTGVPKGAMLTHGNLVSNIVQCVVKMGDIVGDNEVVLGILPFCHAYGLTVCLNTTLVGLGGKLVLLPMPRFSPEAVCRTIQKKKVSLFSGSSRMFEKLKPYAGKLDLSSLKYCTTGAGKTPRETIEFLRNAGLPLYEGYGLSEASPVVSFCTPTEDKMGSVGRPLMGVEIKIVDPITGEEEPVGKTGELIVRGRQVMRGYVNNPEETNRALKDGWLYTGDALFQDADGFLYFVDRMANSGKVNDENVYGEPIREFMMRYAGIKNCVVFFVAQQDGQSPPIVFFVRGESFARDGLLAHLPSMPNPLWKLHQIIEVDETTFDPWFDEVLGKVNFGAAKKYYMEGGSFHIVYGAGA